MIVHTFSDHYKIIYQRSHALLAAQLFACMIDKKRVHHPVETLISIANHDDGFSKTNESYYVNEKGVPKDFRKHTFEKEASLQIIQNAKLKSSWCYILSLYHMQYLYKDRKDNQTIREFLNYVSKQIEKVHIEQNFEMGETTQTYEFVRFTDELSLFLCFNAFNPDDLVITNISNFLQSDQEYQFYPNDASLTAPSGLFLQKEKNVYFEFREIPKNRYNTDKELNNALDKATIKRKEIQLN